MKLLFFWVLQSNKSLSFSSIVFGLMGFAIMFLGSLAQFLQTETENQNERGNGVKRRLINCNKSVGFLKNVTNIQLLPYLSETHQVLERERNI